MIRHLIPRFDWWRRSTITIDRDGDGDVVGYMLAFQWLGLMIEIGIGRVRP